MSIQNTLLTTTAANIYVSSGTSAITAVYLCNTDTLVHNFTVYAVPTAEVPSNTNCIYHNIQLAAGDTYVMDTEKLILGNGDTIRALADASSVISATVSSLGI